MNMTPQPYPIAVRFADASAPGGRRDGLVIGWEQDGGALWPVVLSPGSSVVTVDPTAIVHAAPATSVSVDGSLEVATYD